MCTDIHKRNVWDQLRQHSLQGLGRRLRPRLFQAAAAQAGRRLGEGPLHWGNLVWLAVAAAFYHTKDFAGVLTVTLKLLRDAGTWPHPGAAEHRRPRRGRRRSKHDPRGSDGTTLSEEAFVQARRKMPWSFWVALLMLLTQEFLQAQRRRVYWRGFRLLALDGTCINLPGWQRLRDYFGTASNGKGKQRRRRTQARLVLLQFPLVRIPFRFALTPRRQDEKTTARSLLQHLQRRDLVLMDRGFWSYGLFSQIHAQGAFFAIRRVAQARLPTLRRLGAHDRLVRYQPRDAKKKWPQFPQPLQLRVIDYHIPGFRPSALVTNVTDPQAIRRDDWIRLAAIDDTGRLLPPGVYHRRWEIETTFFELKVRQGLEGHLRSRSPEGIRFEVAGHIVLYLLVRWLLVEAAEAAGLDDPLRLSFSAALQELRDLEPILVISSIQRVRQVLLPRLLRRMASHRVPYRPGRHYPRPNDTKVKNRGHGCFQRPSKLKKRT